MKNSYIVGFIGIDVRLGPVWGYRFDPPGGFGF